MTTNDLLDVDGGANNGQNWPEIDAIDDLDMQVNGVLHSSANSTYIVEVFSSSAAHSSGFGPGETYLGQTFVTTDNAGSGTWTFSGAGPFAAGTVLTATVTDIATSDTSHFSPAQTVSLSNSSIKDWDALDN